MCNAMQWKITAQSLSDSSNYKRTYMYMYTISMLTIRLQLSWYGGNGPSLFSLR